MNTRTAVVKSDLVSSKRTILQQNERNINNTPSRYHAKIRFRITWSSKELKECSRSSKELKECLRLNVYVSGVLLTPLAYHAFFVNFTTTISPQQFLKNVNCLRRNWQSKSSFPSFWKEYETDNATKMPNARSVTRPSISLPSMILMSRKQSMLSLSTTTTRKAQGMLITSIGFYLRRCKSEPINMS